MTTRNIIKIRKRSFIRHQGVAVLSTGELSQFEPVFIHHFCEHDKREAPWSRESLSELAHLCIFGSIPLHEFRLDTIPLRTAIAGRLVYCRQPARYQNIKLHFG